MLTMQLHSALPCLALGSQLPSWPALPTMARASPNLRVSGSGKVMLGIDEPGNSCCCVRLGEGPHLHLYGAETCTSTCSWDAAPRQTAAQTQGRFTHK
jgi:hypothetical protein